MLSTANLRFDIPVENLQRAKEYYAKVLGLSCNYENEFCAQYRYGDSYFVLTPSESAGKAKHSLLTWLVDDFEIIKSWLENRGVIFEDFDFGNVKTEDGTAAFGNDYVAWFKDSEGNLLAIAQVEN